MLVQKTEEPAPPRSHRKAPLLKEPANDDGERRGSVAAEGRFEAPFRAWPSSRRLLDSSRSSEPHLQPLSGGPFPSFPSSTRNGRRAPKRLKFRRRRFERPRLGAGGRLEDRRRNGTWRRGLVGPENHRKRREAVPLRQPLGITLQRAGEARHMGTVRKKVSDRQRRLFGASSALFGTFGDALEFGGRAGLCAGRWDWTRGSASRQKSTSPLRPFRGAFVE
ncbi:hypothetical protein M885DRAFT_33211 [Pelagophyceae sp. CCMP2097]|nr:hypothetical protein M885DRAFT_33211 [Pelagophyceae sp. CCMP2097]|mmetsp:Transcript_31224/g.105051  ORF Transcript_31224/g.105051 Transcript_31224/m.105051 type:complete len:221 (-) Transcript_31224:443-1105(-)